MEVHFTYILIKKYTNKVGGISYNEDESVDPSPIFSTSCHIYKKYVEPNAAYEDRYC